MTEFEFTTDLLVERFIRGQAITNAERAALARQVGGVAQAAQMINRTHAAALASLADWRNCDGADWRATPIGFKRVQRGDYFTIVPDGEWEREREQPDTPPALAVHAASRASYFASEEHIAAQAERAERVCLYCQEPLGLAERNGQRGNWRNKQYCSEAHRKAHARSETCRVRVCPGNAKRETSGQAVQL